MARCEKHKTRIRELESQIDELTKKINIYENKEEIPLVGETDEKIVETAGLVGSLQANILQTIKDKSEITDIKNIEIDTSSAQQIALFHKKLGESPIDVEDHKDFCIQIFSTFSNSMVAFNHLYDVMVKYLDKPDKEFNEKKELY